MGAFDEKKQKSKISCKCTFKGRVANIFTRYIETELITVLIFSFRVCIAAKLNVLHSLMTVHHKCMTLGGYDRQEVRLGRQVTN